MAIETIRPTGAGDSREWTPAAGANWENVDEVTPDYGGSYNTISVSDKLDLFELADHAVSGSINSVTVYMYTSGTGTAIEIKTAIKTEGTVYYGSTITDKDWGEYSKEYTLNPNTGEAWTWDEIDDLQAGIKTGTMDGNAFVTQVYVEVDYTPPRIGTIGGKDIGSIAKFCGKSVTDIAVIGGISNV